MQPVSNYDTLRPYYVIPYEGIAYGTCRDFEHISRYKGLRQVTHKYDEDKRFQTLETPNPFTTNCEVEYYTVPSYEENRLDVIAYHMLGSAQYAWVLAYFNGIEDGFTVREGQQIAVPKNINTLFNKGEILSSVNVF